VSITIERELSDLHHSDMTNEAGMVKTRIEQALGSAVTETASLPVGFGLSGFVLALADGRKLAVKAAHAGARFGGDLSLEAYMLRELSAHSGLPIPAVHLSEPDLLAMDYIESDGGPITASVERHAAELLAALHAKPWPQFGYARDTLIGPLPQPNPPSPAWVPFFREHRLLAMGRSAQAEGRLPDAMLARLERFAARLDDFLLEPAHPSLIHGDLWTGNVLVRGGKVAGLVDPAIYCAHPEIELAFTTLFGTFGRAFFDAYAALSPLEPGFHETRCDIYNLYPTLVHVRLFGGGYLAGVDRILSRLGF
jgi:fructosamine-3-kinase